jgi:hypothetical protein
MTVTGGEGVLQPPWIWKKDAFDWLPSLEETPPSIFIPPDSRFCFVALPGDKPYLHEFQSVQIRIRRHNICILLARRRIIHITMSSGRRKLVPVTSAFLYFRLHENNLSRRDFPSAKNRFSDSRARVFRLRPEKSVSKKLPAVSEPNKRA